MNDLKNKVAVVTGGGAGSAALLGVQECQYHTTTAEMVEEAGA